MSGQPGLEVWGPYEEYLEIRDAILEAGQEFGIEPFGSRAYASNTLESGWIPSPLPGHLHRREAQAATASGCPRTATRLRASLGGSFVSDNIEDYYLTPYELGYGHMVRFDHDFIGREALEPLDKPSQRRKVTLAWNGEDAGRIAASLFTRGRELQGPRRADLELRRRRTTTRCSTGRQGRRPVAVHRLQPQRARELSLAIIDPSVEVGAEVQLVWGEPDGGSLKASVEPHKQVEVRAIVSPVPFSATARTRVRGGVADDRRAVDAGALG